uniref:Terpene synthase 2 n=1 Tax=Jasminum sambac TaxID=660624 RepID=A0A8T9EJZ1_9LAMI|nr:terpene synthase 2 [Jasminum sambac]
MAMIINANIAKPNAITAFNNKLPKRSFHVGTSTTKSTANAIKNSVIIKHDDQTVIRRSGNYGPPIWEFDYIQSLNTKYSGKRHVERAYELQKQVKRIIDQAVEPLDQLELIDNLQRLGISYHFEDEIKQIMTNINKKHCEKHDPKIKKLYETALEFRLLRQHGFNVSQEIFDCFKNENGDFAKILCSDIKGLLQLYEASFMSTEGESTLDMAREFTMKHLQDHQRVDQDYARLVHHALELPLHWIIPRGEARWFIDVYAERSDRNPILLEFAKLDFNIVQASHQQELKSVSSWWQRTAAIAENLPFVRDRLVEYYFWNVGVQFEPQYGCFRTIESKVNAVITTIDDMYDVYGTLEELELFTDIVERWDVNQIDQLPEYMQICFLALYNFVHEVAYEVLKEKGLMIIPYLRKAWTDLCRTYLQEMKWYSAGYTPTLEEYMNNAWISISAPLILVHGFFSVPNRIDKETLGYMENYHGVIRWSSIIFRLANDLATSSDELKRGDIPKSIQCYMNETGVSEDEARNHMRFLILETWKKMNKDAGVGCPFSQQFIEMSKNTARMSQYMFQYGDGVTMSNPITQDRISTLIFEPIPLA